MDLSFLLGGGSDIQLPDPVKQYASAMTLAQLARQNRMGAIEETDRTDASAARRAAAQVFADAQTMGWEAAIQRAAQTNPQGAALAMKLRKEDEGAQVDIEHKRATTRKSNADADKTTTEALAKAASDIGNVAFQEAKQPNKLSLSRVQSVAKFYNKNLPEFSGDPNNPEDISGYLQQLGAQAYDIKDRVTAELTAARDKETGRHNVSTESMTATRDAETGRHNRTSEFLTADGMRRVDARAKESNAIAQGGNVSKGVIELRKEFNSLPEVQSYKTVVPIIKSVQNAPDTTAGDLDVIYGVGKILDPTSVVREGELNLVIKSGSPMERALGQLGYVVGQGRMTASQRAKLVSMLQGRVGELENNYRAARTTYEKAADSNGLPKDQIFIDTPSSSAPAAPARNGQPVVKWDSLR